MNMNKSNRPSARQSDSSPAKSPPSSQSREDSDEMADNPLHQIFLEELADIYNAEQQLVKALPKIAAAAQSDELREAIEAHLEETKKHVQRLEEAAASVDAKLQSKKCQAMEGLLQEGDEAIKEHKGEPSLDAMIIACAQKVEHYEIASYGTLVAWADQMEHSEASELLGETLAEEKAADEKLTEVARETANVTAEDSSEA